MGWRRNVSTLFYREGLNRQQPVAERSVAPEGDPQILGRDVIAALPFPLELGSLVGEDLGQPLNGGRDQRVSVLHGLARLVHEAGLNMLPLGTEILRLIAGEERRVSMLFVHAMR